MFSYEIIEQASGPVVQILYGINVIDECGPWESLPAAINWASEYVSAKNGGLQEPNVI